MNSSTDHSLFGYHILNAVAGDLDHCALINLYIDYIIFDSDDLPVDAAREQNPGPYFNSALQISHGFSVLFHIS